MEIVLASQSARRRDILKALGIDFTVKVSQVDESMDPSLSPGENVQTVSLRKAKAVQAELNGTFGGADTDRLIIASDTVVVCDGEILGKPKDKEHARKMIKMLSGRVHSVISGIAVIYRGKEIVSHEETAVEFRQIDDADIQAYISTDEPYDKAGGYGIQDKASVFVKGIKGDYLNVVGLPVFRLFRILEENFGIRYFEISDIK